MIFRNAIQSLINKETLTFLDKEKEKVVMDSDNNPFPIANLNMVSTNVVSLIKPRTRVDLGQTLVIRILKKGDQDVNEHNVK